MRARPGNIDLYGERSRLELAMRSSARALELLSPRVFVDPKADEEGATSPDTDLLGELGNKREFVCSRMLLVTVRAGRSRV